MMLVRNLQTENEKQIWNSANNLCLQLQQINCW